MAYAHRLGARIHTHFGCFMIRKSIKVFALVFTLFFVFCVFVFVYLWAPYVAVEELRLGQTPQAMTLEYVNVTGEPGCTKFYRVSHDAVDDSQPVFPAHTADMPALDEGVYSYHGNRFLITGYPYQYVRKNWLTGVVTTRESHRFDVISWRIETPYTVWSGKDDAEGTTLSEIRTEKREYAVFQSQLAAENFHSDNYIDCMKN